jgi:hypothetical protein
MLPSGILAQAQPFRGVPGASRAVDIYVAVTATYDIFVVSYFLAIHSGDGNRAR